MTNTTIFRSTVCKNLIMLVFAIVAVVQLQAQVYSFTTCGATGTNGPSQTQINLSYASTNITGVVSNNGIQEWVVPATGLYSIKVAGAKGGGNGGGNGAVLSGEFFLTQGHIIQIVVGQRGTGGFGALGSANSGGGGGGSFVVNKTTNTILLIAGGGGGGNGDYGSSYPNTLGNPASYGTSGNSTYQTGGGINGNGGKNGVTDDPAAGGGGYLTNGENSPGAAFAGGGQAFINGARGGAGRTSAYFGGDGGFGGGGGGTSNVLVRGGGGGGYSGGQGGTYQIVQTTVYTSNSDRGHGAGGGSINNGTNPLTYATNAAAGYVTITTLTTPAGALNFVKTNNTYITVPHSSSLNLGAEFTIESWVNYTGVNSTIIDKGDYNYLLQVNCNNPGFAPNRLNFYNRNTGWVHSTGTVPEGVWTHVAVTLKNGTMTFYINGVASGTAAVTFAQDNGPVNIGRQSPSSCACNIFNGNMDELRVWNRALSSCEINANKSCELSGPQTGLAAYYKFNQGNVNANNSAVNTLTDASGNNNTGTLAGFALNGTVSNWVAGQVSGTCATYTTPNANITGNLTLCAGSTSQLNNAITGGVWSSSNNAVATVSASGLVTGLSAGNATITYTNNCGGVSNAAVTINASPAASISAAGSTILCAGSAITLNANTGAGLAYQWRLNGNPITGATNPSYIANAAGSYTVVVSQNGCSTTSNTVTITTDQIPPVAVCKSANLVLNASGTASIIIPATTTTLIYEDWSGDNQGYYANTSTLNWNVTGDIDRANYVAGMPGIEIDLSGFANGAIETKQTFNFTPGTYTISFLQVANTLAGNAVKVDIGSLFSQTFVTALTISSESATFTVTSNTSAKLKLTQLGTSDPSGSFVGQIKLVKNEAATLAIENGSTDNCSIASITASKTDFTCSDIGTNLVTLTVTDVNGNVATCQAIVTVTDNIAPVLNALPSNISLNATSASGAIVNYTTPTATDNCSVTVNLTSGLASGSTFPIGTTTVTYTATDVSGNTTSGSFTVTVSGIAPVIVCPANITVNSATGQCGANVNFAATETTGIPASVITYSHASGSFFPVGTTTVTVTATNNVGTSTCTFTVTVLDVTPPVLGCTSQASATPVNFMRGTSTGGTASIVSWGAINGAIQYAGSSLGTTCNEVWRPFGTLCDEAPNTNSMTTSTKQNQNSGITWNNGGGTGIFIVDLGATQTFNLAQVYQMFSDGKTTHVRGFYHPSTSATPPSLTDAGWIEMFPETLIGAGVLSGNDVTQPTNINFNATTARYVRFYARNDGRYGSNGYIETRSIKLFSTAPAVNNVVVTAADGQCTAVATYDVQAMDNCSGTVVTYSIPSGSSFPIGSTPVTVTATDASGNVATCSFSVIVNAPEINVTGNGNTIVTGTTTTAASSNTDFGGTLPNTPISKNFVLQNTGTADLKINSIDISGTDASAFSVAGITLPVTIVPNATASFNVVFNNNTPGIKNATVTINNNDCTEATYQYAISAEITCTNPEFINLNPQVQANTSAANCTAVVNYPLSITGIPSPGLTYTFSGATSGSGSGTGTGSSFNKGTTHVIVTGINPCNTVVYEFDVVVADVTAPIAIAQNLSINLNAGGTATIAASQVNNGSSDNCGIASITIDKTNFNCSNVGTNTVTLTVTDQSGNSSTATATVTVIDNILPVITAPANVNVNTNLNCTATGLALGTPVTSDNCSVQSVTNNAPATFPLGNTTVIWTVRDASGNTATASQVVTVRDNTAPVPMVANLPNITAECNVTVTTIPTATDNCSGTINATTTSPLSYSSQGTYTILWRYTDASGNSITQTQTVIIQDVTPPVINCPAPITVTAPANQCGAVVTYSQPTSSDNCGAGTGSAQTLTQGSQFFDYADNRMEPQNSPGLPITFAPTDGQKLAVFLVNCGSTHFMYQNVTLPSSGPITLGFDMKYTNHNGSGFSSSQFIAVELRNPVSNALIATLFKTNPGAPQSTGMIRYTYDLSAYAGQQVRLQIIDATINNFFLDVLLDNITIPGSTLANGSFETGNYSGWTIGSANTNCGTFGIGSGPGLSVVQKAGLPSGSTFPIGTTVNTFEVTDLAGNKSTCSFNVTVNAPEISISGNSNEIVTGDNTPSNIDGTDLGGTIPGNTISKSYVIANQGTAPLIIQSINVNNPAFSRSGISLPATIQPGQSASFTVSFNSMTLGVQNALVTVNSNDCNEAVYNFVVRAEVTCTNPVFTNQNAVVEANTTASSCNTIVNYPLSITGIPTPNLTYVFSGATTGTGSGTGSGALFNKGTTHVVVTAVNPCSTVVNEFDVVVLDVTPPIAIAQNLTINLSATGTASITAAQVNNGSSDNCGIATIVVDKTNFDCSNVGANTVTLTVTDVNGNSSTATAVVTVVDNIAPTAIAQNLTINLNATGTASITAAQVNNGSSDNCGIASITVDKTNFDCSNVGANTVTLTVTDVNGNSSTATAVVTVVDNIAPTAIAQNLTINLNASGTASITAAQVNNGSSDNCGIASITVDKTNFDCSNVGANTVVLTVTDVNGNNSTATAIVTVVDDVAPSIVAPANIQQGTDIGVCGATVNLGTPVTNDNCSIASVTNNAPTLFPVGTTIVTWTVTDVNGNSSTATQTVVIADTQKPSITAPAMVSVVNTPGLCTATVDLGTPVVSDNCGIASVTNNAPALFPVGTSIITWIVTDIHGNVTDTATQKVVVIDNENPTISVTNISVANDAGKCAASILINLPTTEDNCGVAAVMGQRSDQQLLTADYPVGTTTITWTVRDVNGNTTTVIQTIVVTDNEKPVITCIANQVFCANTGGNTQYNIPVFTQSDNCGIASTTYSITGATNRSGTGTNASGNFAIGTSTVSFTVTDIHGNVSTCSFTVIINPLPVASISTTSPDAFCNQFVLTANSTLNGPFTYQWLYNNNTKATTQQLSLGLSDADGVYSVYTTNANGCRSELPATYNYQKQNLISSYTILATKEVKLGQYNKVESGSVGVMSSRGEAEFDKYSTVSGAGSFVKAPRIDTDKGVVINSKIYGVANVTLPTMQYNLSNTRYLQDKTINSNVTATVAGNYDEVTLKKGSNVTLTGTVFGKIKLEEGASVRFTSTTIDVEEIQIEKGPKSGGYSYIRFAPNTSVRVSKKVTIGSDVIVNPEAYQVTFYMADNRRDEEKFHVKGDDTRITANIILPDGKLKVTGGNYGDDKCDHRAHSYKDCRHKGHGHHDCDHKGHGDKDCRDDVFMTGLFIAEEVESEGKNVIWNSYNCSTPSVPVTVVTANNSQATITEEASSAKLQATTRSEEELKVVVMPNPTRTYFTLKLESKYDAPVTLRVIDASGRVVDSRAKLGSNSTVQIGHAYQTGNYFAEFIQGNRRKVIQLIKIR